MTPARRFRSGLGFVLAVAAMGCSDPAGHGGRVANLSIRPVLPASVEPGVFDLAVDRVRVLVLRPPAEAVVDTVVFFPVDAEELSIRLRVPLISARELLTISLALNAGTVLLFSGTASVEVSEAGGTAPPIPLQFVGPGTDMTTLRIEPRDSVLKPGDSFTFLVGAWTGQTPLSSFYVSWSTTDPSTATVDPKGTLTAADHRGTVRLRVVSPTGILDSTTVYISPPPITMSALSGSGQVGVVGSELSAPLEVQVLAPDDLGVPGVRIEFRGLSGGQPLTPLAITDANGIARTRVVLGPVAGIQGFEAEAAFLPTVGFTITALAGPPTVIEALAGSGQTDTVGQVLPQSLVARVSDQLGNPIAGVPVTWRVVAGGGSLSNALSETNLTGITFADYTLGTIPGLNLVRVSIGNTPIAADFGSTAVAGAPATLTIVSGDGQTDSAAAVLAPFVVQVRDGFGNTLNGQTVRWTASVAGGAFSSSETTTDVLGRTSVTYALPTVPGAIDVTAEVVGTPLNVTFAASVTVAAPSVLVAISGDEQVGEAGTLLEPFVVRVTDQFGNPVEGVGIFWEIVEGDGSLSDEQPVSDADGLSQVTYTLGAMPGLQRIRASLPSGTELVFVVETVEPARD